jgi:hypothetical protein
VCSDRRIQLTDGGDRLLHLLLLLLHALAGALSRLVQQVVGAADSGHGYGKMDQGGAMLVRGLGYFLVLLSFSFEQSGLPLFES